MKVDKTKYKWFDYDYEMVEEIIEATLKLVEDNPGKTIKLKCCDISGDSFPFISVIDLTNEQMTSIVFDEEKD